MSEILLEDQPSGEDVHQAEDACEPGDAVVGHEGDVRFALGWKQVMRAHEQKRDARRHDGHGRGDRKTPAECGPGITVVAGQQGTRQRAGSGLRGLPERRVVGAHAKCGQQVAKSTLGAGQIEGHYRSQMPAEDCGQGFCGESACRVRLTRCIA